MIEFIEHASCGRLFFTGVIFVICVFLVCVTLDGIFESIFKKKK
jgi:hypothetical protein